MAGALPGGRFGSHESLLSRYSCCGLGSRHTPGVKCCSQNDDRNSLQESSGLSMQMSGGSSICSTQLEPCVGCKPCRTPGLSRLISKAQLPFT